MNWRMTFAACVGLVACGPPSVQPLQAVYSSGEVLNENEEDMRASSTGGLVNWPLKFKVHHFGVRCFDTLACSVWYDGFEHGSSKPSSPLPAHEPNYLDGWRAGHGGIDNFPGPAIATWVTNDGREHKAEIDIARIFQSELILHNVPREEVSELYKSENSDNPSILMEVNGPTVRVYMRVHIPTRHMRVPGNPNSNYRNDLILVKTYNY